MADLPGDTYSVISSAIKVKLIELVESYDINVLECATNATDVLAEVSLKPIETISVSASKLKGQVSGWLRSELDLHQPQRLLSSGYFACTVGNSSSKEVTNI